MTTTGEFHIHKYVIEFEKYNEPIYLFPFGDVHRSAPNCDVERWLEFLDWAKHKKRAYFLGMGDLDDFASGSERLILGDKRLHDSTLTTLDGLYETHTIRFYNEIKFMGDKLIGLIEGNHYGEFQSGITTTQYLAQKMKAKYLGVSAFIRLIFKCKSRSSSSAIDIWAHHSKSCSYVPKMELKQSGKIVRLHQKKKLIGRTGSFLKGYIPGKKSYVADMALNPTDLGVLKIELTPRSVHTGEQYIDIHTSI